MKPMIWHPEERDQKVNEYLARSNRAPYVTIFTLMIALVCLFTVVVLVGGF